MARPKKQTPAAQALGPMPADKTDSATDKLIAEMKRQV